MEERGIAFEIAVAAAGFPGFAYSLSAMKKALLLALTGLLAAITPVLAHPPAANVNFTSERGVPFGLVLDGRPLTRGVARQVHVDQLVPGQHWADFTLPTAYGGAVRFRTHVWLEPGLETSFVLVARPGWPLDLRQVNAVALCGPGRGYDSQGDGGGHYNSPTGYDPAPYSGQSSYGYPANGNNSGYGNNPTNDDDDDDNGYGPGSNPSGDGAGYYPGSATSSYRPLPPQEVNGLVQAVRQQRFESDKLSTAREGLGQNAIQTEDLKRLLQSLDFEASRVELAKFAYPHVADPQNFRRVYDVFNFETNAREVRQAVSNAPHQRSFE